MFEAEQSALEVHIRQFCSANVIPLGDLRWLPIPFSGEWGISTSFFAAAAAEAKAGVSKGRPVPLRAQEIAEAVRSALGVPEGFSRVEAVNGYLNLYFSTAEYARRVVDEAVEKGGSFGAGSGKAQQLMVEFSHPNTHKAFHVGHLRGTILGDALCRILEFAGHEVIRANYPGDMGLHVIRWLWGYLKFHNGEEPETDITNWMGKVYADAIRRLEENPDLEAEVRAVYARWDRREPEIVELWQRTRQWSLDGFNQMYDALDIRFDVYYFNSQEEEVGKEIVEELVSSGIATDERAQGGAVLVKIDEKLGLAKEMYRTAVVLRSDGTALYATEDLALTLHKFRDHPGLARSIYVVDVRQSLHFTQVFKILEIAGFEEAKKSLHVSYELVTLPGNVVMSSREGTVVLLEDLIREATSRAYAVVKEKNPALTEEQMQSVAKAVGLGALKYPMLARENTRLVTFDWESALDFSGQAAPYVQYAQVRCNSILRKAAVESAQVESKQGEEPLAFQYELQTAEVELIELISRFPSEVERAAAEYKPLIIANLAYELAKAFTSFYDQCPVIKADALLRESRLRLVTAARNTMVNALGLLGIEAPEVM
jgi:arginyl-tRNA synthetase